MKHSDSPADDDSEILPTNVPFDRFLLVRISSYVALQIPREKYFARCFHSRLNIFIPLSVIFKKILERVTHVKNLENC